MNYHYHSYNYCHHLVRTLLACTLINLLPQHQTHPEILHLVLTLAIEDSQTI